MTAPWTPRYAVVVPTVGRPQLGRLLASLAGQDGPAPDEVVIVDDRPGDPPPLTVSAPGGRCPVRVLRSWARGPAAARNRGWQAVSADWVAFLDDDVYLPPGWCDRLAADLARCAPETVGCQGRIVVPPPAGRPTERERCTAGLQTAAWATADMAYRRHLLEQLGGFDERFPRAYREDADLALRCRRAGYRLAGGERHVVHPARDGEAWASVRAEAGNADDALMRHLHGRGWRRDADAPAGRFAAHVATVACALLTVAGLLAGRRRPAGVAALAYGALTGEALYRRLAPGPRPGQPGWHTEALRMLVTTPALPFAAVGHRLVGAWRHRRTGPWPRPVRAVLFDRDGTLVHDVPYNGDPRLVRPVEGAAAALDRLRDHGILLGVITNQSAVGRGLLSAEQVRRVNARIDAELGPFDTWQICPHAPGEGCACRKPQPGLVLRAARHLRLPVEDCVVVGDIGADVTAARRAGARAVLVPNGATRDAEIAAAPLVAGCLTHAVDLLLGETAATAEPARTAVRR